MPLKSLHGSRGFSLLQFSTVLAVLMVLGAFLYSVYIAIAHGNEGPNKNHCLSNVKQIGITMLQYAMDYDESFPPAVSQIKVKGVIYEQQWGPRTTAFVQGKPLAIRGLVDPYISRSYNTSPKEKNSFLCPSVKKPQAGLTYLYNDLASGANSDKDFTSPALTVLITDSEDHLPNVGHARSLKSAGDTAVLQKNTKGKPPKLLLGAAVGGAVTRHYGGAHYCFADGHAKLIKPDDVFSPSRNSGSRSHKDTQTGKQIGPDPTDYRLAFRGKNYLATFHIR